MKRTSILRKKMAWIESHQDLEEHPKLMKLCAKTGWNIDEAIGKLQRLWWWALKYAEDGDLSKYDYSQFLVRLNVKLPAKELYEVLIECNFIEKNGLIHDWLDYAGRYLSTKYRTSNPKYLKKIQQRYKSVQSQTRVRLKSDTLPNLTLPNLKKGRFAPPSIDEVSKYCKERKNRVSPQAFLDFYQSKDWMIGKNKMKDWRAAVRTWEQRDKNDIKGTPQKDISSCKKCQGIGVIYDEKGIFRGKCSCAE